MNTIQIADNQFVNVEKIVRIYRLPKPGSKLEFDPHEGAYMKSGVWVKTSEPEPDDLFEVETKFAGLVWLFAKRQSVDSSTMGVSCPHCQKSFQVTIYPIHFY